MRLLSSIGLLSLCVGIGAIVIGHGVAVPALAEGHSLLDANLARALADPMRLRVAEFVLGASIVMAAVVPRWLGQATATTIALLGVGLAAAQRVVLIPRMHEAWAGVDLVARRPLERIVEAERLTFVHESVLAASLVALLALLLVVSGRIRPPAGG